MFSGAKKWWKKVKQNLIKLLEDKEEKPENKVNTEPQQQLPQQPGLVCPECKNRFPISIPQLLSGQPIFCPNCYLKLEVDQDKSKVCLDELKKLERAFQKAEEIKQQNAK